jgi:glycosyltransferase involved in cell wall biosynthesis
MAETVDGRKPRSIEVVRVLTVVIPAWNEAQNLRRYPGELFPVLAELGTPVEAVIVDDGSTDDTARVASELGAPARLVSHARNQGLGAALRTGFAAAKGELLLTLDADLTFAPSLIPVLLRRFQQGDVDVVSGSPKLAGYAADVPPFRIAVSRVATFVYSRMLGADITSVSPILRLYRTADLRELDLASVGFDINAEILFGLIRKGKRVAEVPAPLTQRVFGQSSLNYRREIVRHLRLVSRMALWRAGLLYGRS